MNTITELSRQGLLCWQTVAVGLKNNWLGKDAVADYAFKLLSEGLDGGDTDIAVLAGTDSLDDREISDLIRAICQRQRTDMAQAEADALEKWRLAKLLALNSSKFSTEEKIDKLQELYADFDYPADMAACSIYSQDGVDPLAAIQSLINELKQKFGIARP